MNTHNTKDILFDDFSILAKLIDKNELIKTSPTSDCDCDGYNSTSNQDDFDTYQITQSFGKAN